MRNLKLMTVVLVTAVFAAVQVEAATVQATVSSVKGTAEVMKPGSAEYKPLKANQVIAIGSTIKTGPASEVILIPMPSIQVTISESTVVQLVELDFAKSGDVITKRKAVLDLQEGKVFSDLEKLDPKTTSYQVKMPQGVAAARGTKYTVTILDGKATVSVIEGTVTMTDKNGKSYTINAGESRTFDLDGETASNITGGVFTDPSALPTILNPANVSGEASPNK